MFSAVVLERMREKIDPERQGVYSPTQLLDCFRKDVFKTDEGYYSDPDELWAMERGNIIHSYLREQPYPGALETIVEQRISKVLKTKYGLMVFSGKPDLVVITSIEECVFKAKIVDWKSASEIKHEYIKPYDDHVMQLNMYKLLVESHYSLIGRKLEVTELELNAISMTKPRRFTSAQQLSAKGKCIKRTYPKEYERLTLERIPKLTNEEIEQWVVERIEAKLEATQDDHLPAILEGEDAWRCLKCPVRMKCQPSP